MLQETLAFVLSLWAADPAAAAVQGSPQVAAPGARQSADEVVSRVQSFYDKTAHLTAKFRQVYTNQTFGKTTVSDGRVWIKKPGKMRWDYASKNKQVTRSLIFDGSRAWAVEHDNKQVFRRDLQPESLSVAVTFLYGQGDLRRDFTPVLDASGTYGSKLDYVLKLTPKKPSAQYKTLWLVVDPGNFRVKQSIVLEASGNTNHFRFFEPDTRTGVKDSWFVFNEKQFKSYRIITPGAE
jgi:outer membrane lipoprotein carrier protein